MPELPEVECWGRQVAEEALVGRQIVSVWTADDRIVFDGIAPRTFARKLKGRQVTAARRRGKQLWLEMDQGPHPLFHFGMSGWFEVYDDPEERPRFCKVELTVEDGRYLAMPDARRFGRIRMRDDPTHESPIADLGPDPLTDMPRLPQFRAMLEGRRGVIKGLLLNQSFLAGIGNWIADEVLYVAGIAPQRSADSLSPDEVRKLHAAIRKIIRDAVRYEADYTRFPKTWLFHRRWGRPEDAKTTNGQPIAIATVAGRSTAWVPARQQ